MNDIEILIRARLAPLPFLPARINRNENNGNKITSSEIRPTNSENSISCILIFQLINF
jgi:hypothetical protein